MVPPILLMGLGFSLIPSFARHHFRWVIFHRHSSSFRGYGAGPGLSNHLILNEERNTVRRRDSRQWIINYRQNKGLKINSSSTRRAVQVESGK